MTGKQINVDDVLVIWNSVPPLEPTGLVATPGIEQVTLDWDDNTERDFNGYNVYRGLTSGSGYTKANGSLVATSNYTDAGLPDATYYYVVTAVDLGSNESGYSNEDNTTPLVEKARSISVAAEVGMQSRYTGSFPPPLEQEFD